MEDTDGTLVLREKLLSAGIDEIVAHGVRDFSLRRVAASCGASCAAPYKHFKNKDEFIEEIIAYVDEKWERLQSQICSAFDDPVRRIAELCVANVRFKVANPLYGMGSSPFAPEITSQIKAYCETAGLDDFEVRSFAISSLTWGAASLIGAGKIENSDDNLAMLKEQVMKELSTD